MARPLTKRSDVEFSIRDFVENGLSRARGGRAVRAPV